MDDEPVFSKMVKLFLEQTGEFIVECESDSNAAVGKARAVKPDAILLDLIMPHKDGAELKAEMDADPFLKDIPKMFLTSNVSKNDTTEGGLVITGDGLMLPKTSQPDMVSRCLSELIAGTI